MKNILVTGGCGFIGSHFVRLLVSTCPDWRVVNVDKLTYAGNPANVRDVIEHPRYVFEHGDIADASFVEVLFKEHKPWAVVNFAAESHVDRSILNASPFLWTNLLGVQILLESARRTGVERFVQISTDEVYGDRDGKGVADEEAPLLPSSPYAASKASADLLCLAYQRTHGVPVVIVRSSNNYGPYQFPEKLIPLMLYKALASEPLPVYGDGMQRRDWLYVTDNCEAVVRVLLNGRAGALYNVGTGQESSNLDVVRVLCKLLADMKVADYESLLRLVRSVADRPGHDRRYAMDTSRVRRELGWRPAVGFEEGMRRTVHWYLEHQDWVRQWATGELQSYCDAVYLRRWRQQAS